MSDAAVIEPARPTADEVATELAVHVRALAGPSAAPRPEQIDAVSAVVSGRRRTLLVARTGFGKSAVYFSATKMLRDRGWGPTVVISPLLALMRDQVAAAERLGLTAVTINSSNVEQWDDLESLVNAGGVDLILIAPERLANRGFRRRVFDSLIRQPFMLVCDEAHCISDWGHDFRPDYRRLRELIDSLPPWTPVLATTATANQRVTDDVAAQLGDDTLVLRTPLDRESLHLSTANFDTDAQRLAWLAETLPTLDGSGIVYCLTQSQAEQTAEWLRRHGHNVGAYTGAVEADQRLTLERGLRDNSLKALVATSALGMGFDKGDLAFCVHLGLPPSPVAYYQQIGRAGRNLERAEVIAVPRPVEDAAVWRWFESVSLPSRELCEQVLSQLDLTTPTSVAQLEATVNLGRTRLSTLLNILDVDGAVARDGTGYVRTDHSWTYDQPFVDALTALRRDEANQMLQWASDSRCRLRLLREALDDATATDCGRCDNCTGQTWMHEPAVELVAAADQFLRGGEIEIEPRRQWPSGLTEARGRIPVERQAQPGRALARVGDGGWSIAVTALIDAADSGAAPTVSDALIAACAQVLKQWAWGTRPTWICPVPSQRRHALIDTVADRIGELGKLPVIRALVDGGAEGWQADQSNSAHQVRNVWNRFSLDAKALADAPPGPVLLIDDQADSRWTIAVVANLLATAERPVLPFTLLTR